MIKPVTLSLLLMMTSLANVSVLAQAPSQAESTEHVQPGWLGVWVSPLSPELKAQLSNLTDSGEGLLVRNIQNPSPAQQAGIAPYDVLLSFNGQKLYSSEQLSHLVHYSNANTQATIQLIHQGKLNSVNVTLAPADRERQGPERILGQTHREPYPRMMPPRIPRHPPRKFDNSKSWEQFESIEVKTLPDGRYRARVSFKDQNDKTQNFTFEGKKYEIVQQIKQLDELPPEKKQALLNALDLSPGSRPNWRHNDLLNEFFNDPWFDHNLFDSPVFNDPWFRDPYTQPLRPPPVWQPPWQLHIYPDNSGPNEQPGVR
jgi:hypothetical protein